MDMNKNINNYSLKTGNGKYLKQQTNELSKYNKEYVNKIRESCLDILLNHSENTLHNKPTSNQNLTNYNTNRYITPMNYVFSDPQDDNSEDQEDPVQGKRAQVINRTSKNHLDIRYCSNIGENSKRGVNPNIGNYYEKIEEDRNKQRRNNMHTENRETPIYNTKVKQKNLFKK